MYATLFDDLPPPPAPPPRKRLRERRHECGKFIRKVKGEKCQVRWWLEGHGSVNCGLYDEWTAGEIKKRLVRETAHHPDTPLGIWHALKVVLAALRKARWSGLPDPEPLPRYVRACGDGGYCAVVRTCRRLIVCPGPFETPEAAYEAMGVRLAREFPAPAARPEPVTLADFLRGWACAA